MINKESLSIEWLKETSTKFRNTDIILVEKTVRALYLLEGLVESGLAFVFKGGTALMLMQGENPKRLSIDIDIILPQRPENLKEILQNIAIKRDFTSVQERVRKVDHDITKAHYKFSFVPSFQTIRDTESSILLDILFEEVPYQHVWEQNIDSPFLKMEGNPLKVKVPSFEDILGDKLTAYAPNTTGIPYFKGKNQKPMGMEIIKQLYDVGHLCLEVKNLKIVKQVFERVAIIELVYRKLAMTPDDVLEDIFQTSLCISLRGGDGKGNFEELQKGIKRLEGYIISERLNIDIAIVQASKVAYMIKLLQKKKEHFVHFDKNIDLHLLEIKQPNNTKLNKLKRISPEAFWYWYNALELEQEI
jgi:predicted nucleotidyltransferase component of viral defense system